MSRLGSPVGASISADMQANVATADLVNAVGEAVVAGNDMITLVKEVTDQFDFTAGNVNANIKAVNASAIQGDGTEGNEWRPSI